MQDYPIQHTLIQTWMISDIDFRVHSSAVTHRRDTNLGIWTWMGLTSDSCHIPHNTNMSINTCGLNTDYLLYMSVPSRI